MVYENNMDTLALETLGTIDRFNDAFNRQDLEAMAALMTEDCVFESTAPSPDGTRFEGRDNIIELFRDFFAGAKSRIFESEDAFGAGYRATVRWVHRWVDLDGTEGHVRGVDVFTVRDGQIAEKLSYVKG
ncbi:nuclear transport factor 2 family protein [Smaragdicoccus niigatensis]